MKYYYFVDRGLDGIFDIAYTLKPLDFSQGDIDVELELNDNYCIRSWLKTPLSDVYIERQDFMKSNNRRDIRIDEILLYDK